MSNNRQKIQPHVSRLQYNILLKNSMYTRCGEQQLSACLFPFSYCVLVYPTYDARPIQILLLLIEQYRSTNPSANPSANPCANTSANSYTDQSTNPSANPCANTSANHSTTS